MTDKSTDNPNEPITIPQRPLPAPPKLTGFSTSGNDLTAPSQVSLSVEVLPRGAAEPIEATVSFRVKDGTATLRQVEEDLNLSTTLLAVEAASEELDAHQAVESVKGIDALLDNQRQWIDDCQEYAQHGWYKIQEQPYSNVACFVDGYKHRDGEKYEIWDNSQHDEGPSYLVEHHDEDGETTKTPHETEEEAQEFALNAIAHSTPE